jgi:hypothetical protein
MPLKAPPLMSSHGMTVKSPATRAAVTSLRPALVVRVGGPGVGDVGEDPVDAAGLGVGDVGREVAGPPLAAWWAR